MSLGPQRPPVDRRRRASGPGAGPGSAIDIDIDIDTSRIVGRLNYASANYLQKADAMSYFSIVTGALSLAPFPPLALPASVASLSAGVASTYLGATNAGPEPRQPAWPIEGDSAVQILESTWNAITGVDATMAQIDVNISRVVSGYLDDPEAFGNKIPPRAARADHLHTLLGIATAVVAACLLGAGMQPNGRGW